MQILIEKNGQQEAREVAGIEEAQALADAGEVVLVPNRDGGHCRLEGVALEDRAVAPAAETQAPAKKAAAKKAPAKKAAAKSARKK